MSIPVSQAYSELMHYTTLDGLRGILSSNCIWATNTDHLNDSSEISHYFDKRLCAAIEPSVKQWVYEEAANQDVLARIVDAGGFEALIQKEIESVASSIREATTNLNAPYIVSLCAPTDDRVRNNGLLSQWRGYGEDGGYAVVFDSKALEEALVREGETYHYMHLQIGDVFYEGIDPELQPSNQDFQELEEIVRHGASRLVRGGNIKKEAPNFYYAITSLSCLCKHWGFWEEREVRIFLLPTSPELARKDVDSRLPSKPIRTRQGKRGEVRYIELFQGEHETDRRLPIKRVIVGPHQEQNERVIRAKELLQQNGYEPGIVESVVASEIPYL